MWVFTLYLAWHLGSVAHGAKILGVFMTPSYSHQIVYQPIWRELSLRGHQVTVYTPMPLNDPSLTNLTEYRLNLNSELQDKLTGASFDISKLMDYFYQMSECQFEHHYLQDLIKIVIYQTYDLFLVEYIWPTYYAFKEVYNVPMVGITSLPLTIGAATNIGMDKHPVVDPDLTLGFTIADTLIQRVYSWLFKWTFKTVLRWKYYPMFTNHLKKYFPKVKKDIAQLSREVSLVLGNYNFAIQSVRPMTPKFIPLSGIHLKPQQPLPTDLAEVMDTIPNDAIYFSFGTNVNPGNMSKTQINKLLNVLAGLPYTILFKYDSKSNKYESLPKNFFVREWFPQQDILGHPKVKLFITQGGLQSIDEAISKNVPMLIFPFFGDQKTNAAQCQQLGIAETLSFKEFDGPELEDKITKLLNDPSYQINLKKQRDIVNDEPMTTLDKAVFWIEHIIRHKGADHLHYKAVDLPFYQYYLLDVYLVICSIAFLFYHVSRQTVKVLTWGAQKLILSKEKKSKRS